MDEPAGLYVKITLDGGREMHQTVCKETPCWDEDLNM